MNKIKISEMYKELRPYYIEVIKNVGLQYYIVYNEKTKELEILDEVEIENYEYDGSCLTISEYDSLSQIFDKINEYVRNVEEYLRNRVNIKV